MRQKGGGESTRASPLSLSRKMLMHFAMINGLLSKVQVKSEDETETDSKIDQVVVAQQSYE